MKNKPFKKEARESKSVAALESLIENISLMLEDASWRKASESIFGENADKFTRDAVLKDSIKTYREHPAYKHVIELNKSFVLGAEGFARPVMKNPLLQYVVDMILNNKENKRTFCGYRAQEKIMESKGLKGEIFFKIYVNKTTGEIIIRQEKDTSKVIDVITQTGDADYRLYYKYKQCQKEYDYESGKSETKEAVILIPDIMNDDKADIDKRGAKSSDGNVRVFGYLATFGDASTDDGRGMSEYVQTFKYFRAHKQISEDATTMLKALTRFAWKKKFKGDMSKNQLDGIKKLAQTFSNSQTINTPPASTASTLLETENVDNQQVEVKHNATAFMETSRIIMQQIASGTQKMEHYFGNPANANLATATSMELPMLKDFQRQQAEFAEVIEIVLTFCVLKTIELKGSLYISQKAKELDYDLPSESAEMTKLKKELDSLSWSSMALSIRMPEILDKEVQTLILAIINAFNAGLIGDIDASYLIYSLLGHKDIDEKVSELFGDNHEVMTGAGTDKLTNDENLKAMAAKIQAKVDEKKKADELAAAKAGANNEAQK